MALTGEARDRDVTHYKNTNDLQDFDGITAKTDEGKKLLEKLYTDGFLTAQENKTLKQDIGNKNILKTVNYILSGREKNMPTRLGKE